MNGITVASTGVKVNGSCEMTKEIFTDCLFRGFKHTHTHIYIDLLLRFYYHPPPKGEGGQCFSLYLMSHSKCFFETRRKKSMDATSTTDCILDSA